MEPIICLFNIWCSKVQKIRNYKRRVTGKEAKDVLLLMDAENNMDKTCEQQESLKENRNNLKTAEISGTQ